MKTLRLESTHPDTHIISARQPFELGGDVLQLALACAVTSTAPTQPHELTATETGYIISINGAPHIVATIEEYTPQPKPRA